MKIFFLLLSICSLAPKILSAELSATPAFPENRFLFIVETSLAMNRSSKAVQETIHELIGSGLQGQMHSGDTLGLWTFNDKLNAEFPMQRWSPEEKERIAQTVGVFLKKQRYEKKSELRTVLPPLYSVIRSSKAITIVLISTGNEPIQGTPFDKEINTIYPAYVRELQDAKLAFVTILVGRNGRPVDYTVNSSLGPIQIPHPPIEPEKIIEIPKTNAVVAVKKQVSAQTTNRVSAPKPVAPKTIPDASKTTAATNQQVTANATAVAKVEPKAEIKTNEAAAVISTNLSIPITAPKIETSTPLVETNSTGLSVPAKIEPPKIASESSVTTTVQASTSPASSSEPQKKAEPVDSPSLPTVSNVAPSVAVAATNSVAKAKPYDESIRDRTTEETASANSTLPDFQAKNSKPNSEIAYNDPSAFKPQMQGIGVPRSTNLPKPTSGLRPDTLRKRNTAPLDPASAEKPISPAPVVATQSVFTSQKLLLVGVLFLLVAGLFVFFLVRHSRKSQPSLISRSIDRSK